VFQSQILAHVNAQAGITVWILAVAFVVPHHHSLAQIHLTDTITRMEMQGMRASRMLRAMSVLLRRQQPQPPRLLVDAHLQNGQRLLDFADKIAVQQSRLMTRAFMGRRQQPQPPRLLVDAHLQNGQQLLDFADKIAVQQYRFMTRALDQCSGWWLAMSWPAMAGGWHWAGADKVDDGSGWH